MEREIGDIKGAVGELKGTVSGLKEDIEHLRDERKEDNRALKQDIAGLQRAMEDIRDTLAATKGSWRTLIAVASATAAVAAFIGEAVRWLKHL